MEAHFCHNLCGDNVVSSNNGEQQEKSWNLRHYEVGREATQSANDIPIVYQIRKRTNVVM